MATQPLPLVLIHGYPLEHSMWHGVIAALGSRIRAYVPDLRGFGKAGAPEGEPSIDLFAADIEAMLQREKIDRAVVAGMSMGGYVALALAEMAPERIAGLALVNSQPFSDSDDTRRARREMIRKIQAEGPGAAAKAALPKMFSSANAENPDFQKFVVQGAESAGTAGLSWALEAMARRPDRSAVLKDAQFPILIVHSLEDQFIPIDKAKQMADLNPSAHFVAVKRAGHGAAMEAPDEVASALRKFHALCAQEAPSPTAGESAKT